MTPDDQPDYATTTAVAGLAREIEALRCSVAGLAGLPGRVEAVADLVGRLADQIAAAGEAPVGTVTWLDLPEQHARVGGLTPADAEARVQLERLAGWMGGVYLRYADAKALPACWLWHPEVVEELCWLRQAWLNAYANPETPVTAAADWHDRLRPGVVRRITGYAGMCSIEQHRPDADRHTYPVAVPLAAAVDTIAAWWTTGRSGLPPVPTAEQVAEGAPARGMRGRR
jgi:hypothetical protein